MTERANNTSHPQDVNNISYYNYYFDLEKIDPLEGIKEISKVISSKVDAPNTHVNIETELTIFALLISRATEEGVPFGSIVKATYQSST
jgi:hypothetical protein